MYASGSTWLFNAAHAVAAELHPELQYQKAYLENLSGLTRLPPGHVVVKSHHLSAGVARLVLARSGRILVSLRDPRDAVTSLMQHMGHDFVQALRQVERSALFCAHYAKHERATLFIYEQGFTEHPETFDRLAGCFGLTLPEIARETLFAAFRRHIIEAQIAKLKNAPTSWRNPVNGDLVDTATQWHAHHAGRTGEPGRWRQFLSEANVQLIEMRLANFMATFGYGPEACHAKLKPFPTSNAEK